MSVSKKEIFDQFLPGTPAVTRLNSDQRTKVPAAWSEVFEAPTSTRAVSAALRLWGDHGQQLMPEFWSVFSKSLADVWVAARADGPVLVYVVEHLCPIEGEEAEFERTVAVWLGTPPIVCDSPHPSLFAAAPPDLVNFGRRVHGGFTGPDGESYGILPVLEMPSLAEAYARLGMDPRTFDEDPQPDRLLVVGQNETGLRACLSPEFPSDKGRFVRGADDPDPENKPVPELLDRVLMNRFEVEW